MRKSWAIFFCTVFCILGTIVNCPASPVTWEVSEGGNGHRYEAIPVTEGITWADASVAVQAMEGNWHLVTITSAEENAFVLDLVNDQSEFWTPGANSSLVGQMYKGPWIGGYSSSYTANDWTWETGEPFDFSAWGHYEPFGNGDRICWAQFGNSGPKAWNDARNYGTYSVPGYIVESAETAPIPEPCTIDIHPDTLNMKSKGKYVTCYIELPEGFSVYDIDIVTVMLTINGASIAADSSPTEIGDYNDNDILDCMVKFDRQSIQDACNAGAVEFTLSCETYDGTAFEGTDTVLVIDKGQEHYGEYHESIVY